MKARALRPMAVISAGALGLVALVPRAGHAHGFGQRYDLPVPLWLWVAGAAAAVVLSFAVVGVFVRGTPGLHGYPRVNLLRWKPGRLLAHTAVRFAAKVLAVGLLMLVVVAGVAGSQNPTRNLVPTTVWVLWWVGLAYVSALVGNVWALVNPWAVLFGWAEALVGRGDPDDRLALDRRYPRALGVWPAVVLFIGFAWVELVWSGRAVPAYLALLTVGYSLVTWAGMMIFGRAVWLRHGDPFALAFGVLARFAPTEVRVTDPAVCRDCVLDCRDGDGECVDCYECFASTAPSRREWNLRPPALGLLRREDVAPSMVVFVLLLLATVTFDGFTSTPAWAAIESAFYTTLPTLGGARLAAIGTAGLLAFPSLFLGVYGLFAEWIGTAGGGGRPTGVVARAFVFSLVPIALAYHLAHYLTYLLIQGQLIVPLLSDPFGRGWNLFGTATLQPDIGIVGARFAWYTAITAIVLGHIVAVYLAHVIALREFGNRRLALRSQYPMLALMVGYTVVSLWIIAQPIVGTAGA